MSTLHLAKDAVIYGDGVIVIDGAVMPWYVAEGWSVTGDPGIRFLNVAILAENIRVVDEAWNDDPTPDGGTT